MTLSPTIILSLVAALLAALAAAWWWLQRRPAAPALLGDGDRFAAVAALSPVQVELLSYLYRAFPGRPVLVRAALSHLVSVRAAQDRLGAQRRLADHSVDYVVCTRDGRPVYAFEVDAAHGDPAQAAADALEKHRVLKSAGIRLVRLTRSSQQMPPPDEFRRQLRAAAIESSEAAAPATASPRRPVADDRITEAEPIAAPFTADTAPMTLTDLMALPPAPAGSYDLGQVKRRN